MAINCGFPLTVYLIGDGMSLTWSYTLSELYGVYEQAIIMAPSTVPNGAMYTDSDYADNVPAIAMVGGQLQVVYPTALGQQMVDAVSVWLLFSSQ